MQYDADTKSYIYKCPHCDLFIQVLEKEINCQIFRHGVLKDSYKQMNPHAPKSECDRLAREGLIHGCGKPYEMYKVGTQYKVRKCEYK